MPPPDEAREFGAETGPGRSTVATPPQRCFVALPIDLAVRERLRAVQRALEPRLPAGSVRWTDPASAHLTLRFHGDLTPPEIDDARRILDDVAGRHAPFELATAALGVFPDRKRPSVAWLGVAGDLDALADLHADLQRRSADVGAPPDRRPFRPHLTLGRVKRGEARRDLIAALADFADAAPVTWRVTRIDLLASDRRPDGAVYTALHSAAL